MTTEEMWELRELLGMDVVLVPIPAGKKGPRIKNWQKLTVEVMDRDAHLRSLENHANTGVILGRASGGLCSIDIDDDAEMQRFLMFNPSLKNTLQTRGERGGNLWVRAGDSAPGLTNYYLDGEPWGEWRSDGGLTVISGIHPCGKPYKFINRVAPIKVDFHVIAWPDGVSQTRYPSSTAGFDTPFGETGASSPPPSPIFSKSLYDSESSSASACSASLHDREKSISLAIEAARAKQVFIEQYPHLDPYYDRWIGRNYQPTHGTRNDALVNFLTFLAHCLAPEIAILFALQFYDRNQVMWKDSREQHEREALNHLGHVLACYPKTLTATEATLYSLLDERSKTTFRIGRDLASDNAQKTGEATFFLSCQNLGHRINLDQRQADRILKELTALGVIEVVKKGTARQKGKRCKATTYRWLLSLKPRTTGKPATPDAAKPDAD